MSVLAANFHYSFSFLVRNLPKIPKLSAETLDSAYSTGLFSFYKVIPTVKGNRYLAHHHEWEPTASTFPAGANCDLRMAWHEQGLLMTVMESGRKTSLLCDADYLEVCDGFRLCLDTRDVRDVHRATRFCHRFIFLPCLTNPKNDSPAAFWLPIHRSKTSPNPVDISRFQMTGEVRSDGYTFSVFIPSTTLTGYEPQEHRRLGIHFAINNCSTGLFSLVPPLFPAEEDPSLWSTIELID